MSEFLALSTGEVIASGVATAVSSYSLLYLNAILQWRRYQLPKAYQPLIKEGWRHYKEYLLLFKRWKAGAPTYVNDGKWLEQLGLDSSASSLKVISKIEALLDESKSNKLEWSLQHAVLEQFYIKAKNRMQVKSARQRLLADQKATSNALAGETPKGNQGNRVEASTEHPISKAFRNAKPLEPTPPMSLNHALHVLGLSVLANKRQITGKDVRTAYKAKKRSARNDMDARKRLEAAFTVALQSAAC